MSKPFEVAFTQLKDEGGNRYLVVSMTDENVQQHYYLVNEWIPSPAQKEMLNELRRMENLQHGPRG